MPGNLLSTDTNFPDLSGKGSTEEKLKKISGYLYMLLEQLRYTLNNLGQDNFNSTELDNLGRLITEPLAVRINDTEKGLAQIIINVGGISSAVKDVSGNVSKLQQTAESISTQVKENAGTISTVQQTANNLEAKFQAGGQITKIEQSLDGLGIIQILNNDVSTSALSGVSLYFYDGSLWSAENSLGFTNGKGNIVGQIKMDGQGDGSAQQAQYRMFVGTGQGKKYNGIGYDDINYSLKLQSAGDSSYSSKGDIWINPAGALNIQIGGTKWTFTAANILKNDKPIKFTYTE